LKIKSILFSQNPPADFDKTPYAELAKKYNIQIDFFKFFQIEGLNANQFRKNRICITDYSAFIFTSKNAIDHFFAILKEMKIELSIDIKFFCINESTAHYLQKYIVYRKRKIFYADGTAKALVKILNENTTETFLLPCSLESSVNPLIAMLDEKKINYKRAEVFQIAMADLNKIDVASYDMIVFFSPFGIQSLKSNFPDYQQGETIMGALGYQVLETAEAEGIQIQIMAPTPEHPSIFTAIDQFLQKTNGKRR